jgi:hypothetical protein
MDFSILAQQPLRASDALEEFWSHTPENWKFIADAVNLDGNRHMYDKDAQIV